MTGCGFYDAETNGCRRHAWFNPANGSVYRPVCRYAADDRGRCPEYGREDA